jgi:signal transduction protein with GAF and PtsI domain
MRPRHQFIADERFAPLISALEERMLRAADLVSPENIRSLWGHRGEQLLKQTALHVGAHAVGLWLRDRENRHLVLAYNTGASGPAACEVRRPNTEGIVSLVLHSEQPFLENDVQKNAQHSKLVDMALHQRTEAMIATPFYLQSQCRGVLSCVQIRTEGGPANPSHRFEMIHLEAMQLAATMLGDAVDYQLLRTTLGWT